MEFVLVIGLLAVLFWAGAVFWRCGPIGGALAVLLVGSCFNQPSFHLSLGPVPLTADCVLLGLLLAQYLLYRQWGWIEPKPLERADFLLAGWLVLLVASTVTHDYRANNAQPLSQLVLFYAMPSMLYWVVRENELSERSGRWLATSLAAFGGYLCLAAIAEAHGAWTFVFPKSILTGEYRELFNLARGPQLNPVAGGMLQSLGLCAALMWWPRMNRPARWLLVALLPVFAWGIYDTQTPSVWIGAAAGLTVVATLSVPRAWRPAVFGGAVLTATVVGVVDWHRLRTAEGDGPPTATALDPNIPSRPVMAIAAWRMFCDHPILGCGLGQYEQASREYLAGHAIASSLDAQRPYVSHNVFVATLTETGLIGLGLYLALLASWTRVAWRLWHSESADLWVRQIGLVFLAFLVIYLANGALHDVAIIPMVNMFLFFLGGAVVGLAPWLVHETSPQRLKLWMAEREMVVGSH